MRESVRLLVATLLASLVPLAAGGASTLVFSTFLVPVCESPTQSPCRDWSIGLFGWPHLGSQLVATLLIALVAMAAIWRLRLEPLPDAPGRALGVVGSCVAASCLIEILNLWTGSGENPPTLAQASVALSFATIVLMVLLAPVVEELFFRGLVQRFAMRYVGPRTSILVASLPFTVLHGSSFPTQTILLFLLSLIWGWAYWRTGLLWVPMLAHGLNNGLSLAISGILS